MTTLKVYKTHPNIVLPKFQTTGSACFDIAFQSHGKRDYKGYNRMNKQFTRPMNDMIVIQPGDRVMVPTGFIFDIPDGYSVRVHARSGLSLKQGLVLVNAEGVIDSDYIDETMVLLYNMSDNQITINGGERIAQAELVKNEVCSIEETVLRPIGKTNRTGGFGSTGTSYNPDTGKIIITINEPEISKLVKKDTPKTQKVESEKRGRGRPRKNA